MTNQNLLIDNLAFAARGERLQAKLPLSDFPRLSELISSQQTKGATQTGEVEFRLEGEKNVLGQCFLHLTLNVNLLTSCQRCLTDMPLTLALNFHYLISNVDADTLDDVEAEAGDDFDVQEVSQSMDVKLLVEDEVIIALPIAPVHEGDCAPATMQSGEKPNPFAALKGLIKS